MRRIKGVRTTQRYICSVCAYSTPNKLDHCPACKAQRVANNNTFKRAP